MVHHTSAAGVSNSLHGCCLSTAAFFMAELSVQLHAYSSLPGCTVQGQLLHIYG
jgi:hypothetical protein